MDGYSVFPQAGRMCSRKTCLRSSRIGCLCIPGIFGGSAVHAPEYPGTFSYCNLLQLHRIVLPLSLKFKLLHPGYPASLYIVPARCFLYMSCIETSRDNLAGQWGYCTVQVQYRCSLRNKMALSINTTNQST